MRNITVQSGRPAVRSRKSELIITLALSFCATALPIKAQIALRAAGAHSTGTGATISPAIPAGVQGGDLAVLVVAGRPTNATEPAAPAGWTLRSSSTREVGGTDGEIR